MAMRRPFCITLLSVVPMFAQAPAAANSTDFFLKLAESVGQGIPAKRLIEYKLKNDPTGKARYWAVVDFNQNSTRKRFYIFDTQDKRVETYYVAHGKGSEGETDDGVADVFSNEEGSETSSLGIYRTLDEYVGGRVEVDDAVEAVAPLDEQPVIVVVCARKRNAQRMVHLGADRAVGAGRRRIDQDANGRRR